MDKIKTKKMRKQNCNNLNKKAQLYLYDRGVGWKRWKEQEICLRAKNVTKFKWVKQLKTIKYLMGIKNGLTLHHLQKIPTNHNGTQKLKMNCWNKTYYTNINQEKAEVTMLIFNKLGEARLFNS